jgi:hypothetical protein
MWINITTGAVMRLHSDIRAALPNVSLPASLTDAMLSELGFAAVEPTAPMYDPATQTATEVAPVKIGASWAQSWAYADLSPAEIEARHRATIPASVTMRQARLALLASGLLDGVTAAVTAAGPAALIEWDYAQSVDRASGLVPQMATALGMTASQIDALFVAAAAL